MSKDVATVKGGLPALSFNREQVDLIKRTIAKGATDDELALFLHTAKTTGLDPLRRQIHAIKRWDSSLKREVMAVQTGIDGYRLVADRTERYVPGDVTVELDGAKIVSATATVKKLVAGVWHEIRATAYFDEYAAKKKDGSLTHMWATKGRLMISKCAEALVLRKAFPAELSGVYTHEEMSQAGNPIPAEVVKREEPAEEAPPEDLGEADDYPQEGVDAAPEQKATARNGGDRRITKPQAKRFYAKGKSAGKTDEEMKEYLDENYGYLTTAEILVKHYDALCSWAEDKTTTKAAAV